MKCSNCGRPVAGHLATYGVPHGPRCTLTPLSETVTSEGGDSTEKAQGSDSSLVGDSNPQATTSSVTPPSVSSPQVSVAPSGSKVLTNEELEAELVQKYEALKVKLHEAEQKAKQQTLANIYRLDEQSQIMQARIDQLTGAPGTSSFTQPIPAIPMNSGASAPPATSTATLLSSVNPLAPPTVTAGISASAFGQSGSASLPAISGIPTQASLSVTTASVPSASSAFIHGIPSSAVHPGFSSTAPDQSQAMLHSQAQLGQSAPGLHGSWPNLGNPAVQGQMAANMSANIPANNSNTLQSQAQSLSLPDLQAALLSSNPQMLSSLAVKPDDIIKLNPIARAMVGLGDIPKDGTVDLGKYIPELYSLKYGKVEEIRTRMNYSDFIAMYVRMLVDKRKSRTGTRSHYLPKCHNL